MSELRSNVSDYYDYMEFKEAVDDITPEEQDWIEAVPTIDDFEEAKKTMGVVERLRLPGPLFRDFLQQYGFDTGRMVTSWRLFPAFNSRVEDGTWWIEANGYALVRHVSIVVQAFLKKFRPHEVFLLAWAQRGDERDDSMLIRRIGGGWLMVTHDEIVEQNVWNAALKAYEDYKLRPERKRETGVGKVIDDAK